MILSNTNLHEKSSQYYIRLSEKWRYESAYMEWSQVFTWMNERKQQNVESNISG